MEFSIAALRYFLECGIVTAGVARVMVLSADSVRSFRVSHSRDMLHSYDYIN